MSNHSAFIRELCFTDTSHVTSPISGLCVKQHGRKESTQIGGDAQIFSLKNATVNALEITPSKIPILQHDFFHN